MLVIASAGLLTACGTGQSADLSHADIANVANVKSSFGSEFKVTSVGPTGIDPRLLGPQTLPPGVTFDPADCAKAASQQVVPQGMKGNMAATTAEGDGNRFIAIAVETSEAVPRTDPAQNCQKVGFSGPGMRGLVEVVEAPQIDARPHGGHSSSAADDGRRQATHRRALQLRGQLRHLPGDRHGQPVGAAGQARRAGQHAAGA